MLSARASAGGSIWSVRLTARKPSVRASAGRSIAKLIAFFSGIWPGPLNAGRLWLKAKYHVPCDGLANTWPSGRLTPYLSARSRHASRGAPTPLQKSSRSSSTARWQSRTVPPIVHTISSTFAGPLPR